MKKMIKLGFIPATSNVVFSQLVTDLVKVVDDATFIESGDNKIIEQAVSNLMECLQSTLLLKSYVSRQDLTVDKRHVNDERRAYGRLIVQQLKALLNSDEEKINARFLLNWIRDIAPKFPNYPYEQSTRVIELISSDMEMKSEVVEAITDLGLTKYFVKLANYNDEFSNLQLKNTQMFSVKNLSTSQTKSIRDSAYKAIVRVVDAVEWSIEMDENNQEYKDLHFQIRKVIMDAHFAYQMRRKRKRSDDSDSNSNSNKEEIDVVSELDSVSDDDTIGDEVFEDKPYELQ